ncbi:HlyIII-domain-containing protein [Cytidiella melzeri]|nr:HlyIII-domain-containing protein [Cytidiella melzeri]
MSRSAHSPAATLVRSIPSDVYIHGNIFRLAERWKLPPWRKDNEYLQTGYRRTQYSFRGCAASVFGYLHNETVNIHSHLWGAVLFCYLLVTFHQRHIAGVDSATWEDAAMFALFLAASVTCLSFSAFYHTCDVHSKEVASSCNAFDYAGIVSENFQILYLSVFLVAGPAATYIVLNPEYRKPTHRGARTKVFVSLGLCGVVPIVHALLSHGFTKLCYEMGFGWLLTSAALYLNGAALYANRIPERLYPGSFDYFFASHQIFHVHVLLAALSHYMCLLTAFDHWHNQNSTCSV